MPRPLVPCPTCDRPHPGYADPADRAEPHYCSIPCYIAGNPEFADARRLCPGCQRYFTAKGGRRHCSDACRVAEWRRRQPSPPPATRAPAHTQPAVVMDATTIDATERDGPEEALLLEHPPAYTDEHSAVVVDGAVGRLGTLRRVRWVSDAGAVLHVLASLATHIEAMLPDVTRDARDQGYTWSEIAAILGVSRARAQRLAARRAGPRGTTIGDERSFLIDD